MASSFTERMIGAALLKTEVFEEIEADQNALPQAMTIVVLGAVAAGIGALSGGVMAIVISVFAALVGWFLWAGLTYVIGTKLLPEPQTKSDMGELLRVLGFAATPGLLRVVGIIPILGTLFSFIIAIWMLVATVIAVRAALDYTSTLRAVGVCFIGWVIMVFVTMVFGVMAAFGTALMS